ncbi:CPBP family intramembrane glutamic endopeptidase [Cyanobium sp. N5-Cardenillas]|uniref:CPBP family intramembrane glutamic endopeptidase n=1 Tax=Cyanobium sp. N5-Cardenillas TaxID=2823720 RepID=UPI0020CD8F9E|nr:CPBP family intramembrane glutamic endopeptidase [Cyanobium sp. N5-Cardenillas]MCP9785776.1 CPBP family intramembrane metalloprotease [Cyanobium sp. N5-Cardenillas]
METTASEGASEASRGPRVRPTIRLGIALWLAYSALAGVLQFRTGLPYTDWFKTAGNAFATAVVPLSLGGLALLAFSRWCRWNHVWRDPVRLRCTGLMKLSMLAWMAMVAFRLVGIQWGAVPTDLLLAILAAGVGVGFAEELLFRGLFLRCLRQGGRSEASAAIWTGLCFGLFHLPNVFMGMGWFGLIQVVLAALSGILLYVFRRDTGLLWPAMVAHGLWDISTFLAGGYAYPWLSAASVAAQGVFVVLGLLVYVGLYRNDRGTVVLPGHPQTIASTVRELL